MNQREYKRIFELANIAVRIANKKDLWMASHLLDLLPEGGERPLYWRPGDINVSLFFPDTIPVNFVFNRLLWRASIENPHQGLHGIRSISNFGTTPIQAVKALINQLDQLDEKTLLG